MRYKTLNYNYTTYTTKGKKFYIDQKLSQAFQPKKFKTWKLWNFFVWKIGDFNLNREILKFR